MAIETFDDHKRSVSSLDRPSFGVDLAARHDILTNKIISTGRNDSLHSDKGSLHSDKGSLVFDTRAIYGEPTSESEPHDRARGGRCEYNDEAGKKRVWGDPHLVADDGTQVDDQIEAGKDVMLLQSKDGNSIVGETAKFDPTNPNSKATVFDRECVTLSGGTKILFAGDGKAYHYDPSKKDHVGAALKDGEVVTGAEEDDRVVYHEKQKSLQYNFKVGNDYVSGSLKGNDTANPNRSDWVDTSIDYSSGHFGGFMPALKNSFAGVDVDHSTGQGAFKPDIFGNERSNKDFYVNSLYSGGAVAEPGLNFDKDYVDNRDWHTKTAPSDDANRIYSEPLQPTDFFHHNLISAGRTADMENRVFPGSEMTFNSAMPSFHSYGDETTSDAMPTPKEFSGDGYFDKMPTPDALPDKIELSENEQDQGKPLDSDRNRAENQLPSGETELKLPGEGGSIREIDPSIDPRLGCALAVSNALHELDSNFPVTSNNRRLQELLQKHGYEMLPQPDGFSTDNLSPGDVIIGARPGTMPGHSAIYKGAGKLYENDSHTGLISGEGLPEKFTEGMHDQNGNWNKNGFEKVMVFRKSHLAAPPEQEDRSYL